MANENKENLKHEVEKEITRKIEESRHRVLDESSDKSVSRDISKMQAPDEWPDPPKKNKE